MRVAHALGDDDRWRRRVSSNPGDVLQEHRVCRAQYREEAGPPHSHASHRSDLTPDLTPTE